MFSKIHARKRIQEHGTDKSFNIDQFCVTTIILKPSISKNSLGVGIGSE